jgi:hypothetical protein
VTADDIDATVEATAQALTATSGQTTFAPDRIAAGSGTGA